MMKHALQEALLLLISAVVISLVVNALRPEGIRLFGDNDIQTINNRGLVEKIDIDDAILKYNSQTILFVDARLPEDYSLGHIKGAVNLPEPQFDQWINDILQEIDPLTEIVTYCSGIDCSLAKDLAEKFCQTGFEKVFYFPGGYEQWAEHQLPVENLPPK